MQTRVGGFEEQALALRSATTTTTTTVVVTRPSLVSPVGGPRSLGEMKGALVVRTAQKNGPFLALPVQGVFTHWHTKNKVLCHGRCGFWLLGAIFGLQWPQSHLRRRGIPFSEFKNIDFERSHGHFGPINGHLEVLILDTGFRHLLLALNGRNFGINAHLAVNPTPHRRLKGNSRKCLLNGPKWPFRTLKINTVFLNP